MKLMFILSVSNVYFYFISIFLFLFTQASKWPSLSTLSTFSKYRQTLISHSYYSYYSIVLAFALKPSKYSHSYHSPHSTPDLPVLLQDSVLSRVKNQLRKWANSVVLWNVWLSFSRLWCVCGQWISINNTS